MNKKPATEKAGRGTSGRRPARSKATPPPEMQPKPTIDPIELNRFLALKSHDPHHILGAHHSSGGVIIRAFRPEAEKVEVIIGTKRPQPMSQLNSSGLFEILIPDLNDIPTYRFKVHYPDGVVFTLRDPYSVLPTVGELDLHLFAEGWHEAIYEKLGAHVRKIEGVTGVSFAVWAPNADGVSVLGDFNGWDGRLHPMRMLGSSGVWELFIPDLQPGTLYKYEIRAGGWLPFLKADPYASYMEIPPATSSIVFESNYKFSDQEWLNRRAEREHYRLPLSIYEVHFGSWRRLLEENNRPLQYRELAPILADYLRDMAFTHVEFLPLKEHPYGPSWGYQVSNYYAPSARYGTPDDFRYLIDYLHQQGLGVIMDWVPNEFGGRENLEAISLLKELNQVTHRACPGVMMIAEESTAWPAVSRPTYAGGLGFDFKWNMGWMHDTLHYFEMDPVHRAYHHNSLTFGLLYAWSENFILPFSHDEVVHGKGALLNKMPGDLWQKFANLRALYGYMWAHPGKKLLFMGGEFGQWREWNDSESLDWHLLGQPFHQGVQRLVRDLNLIYDSQPALWQMDNEPSGFQWIEVDNALENILSFRRISPATGKQVVCVCNFSPLVRKDHRQGLPHAGEYRMILNTDNEVYGGSGVGVTESISAQQTPSHGLDYSAAITLPPL